METLKVGVMGVGRMGQRHCRIYSNLRRVQLAGVCDVDRDTGAKAARQYEAPFYADLDELLDNVDAVSLATPTPAHFDLALHCLKRRRHVLIEKPITETIEQAEALTEAAEASGLVVMVGHIERFNTAYMELKNVLESMKVLAVNVRRLSAFEGSNTDVDVVLDLMIHDADLVLDLIGQEPTTIQAYGLTAFSGVTDHATVQLGFEAGPLLTLTTSRVTEQKVRAIEVTAQEAYLECDLLNKSISVHRRTIGEYLPHANQGLKYRQESIVERIHVPTFEPLFLELQHFVGCAMDGKASIIPARDGLKALRLVENIRREIRGNFLDARGQAKFVPASTHEPVLVTG
jgi:predicted dehydrogenase